MSHGMSLRGPMHHSHLAEPHQGNGKQHLTLKWEVYVLHFSHTGGKVVMVNWLRIKFRMSMYKNDKFSSHTLRFLSYTHGSERAWTRTEQHDRLKQK